MKTILLAAAMLVALTTPAFAQHQHGDGASPLTEPGQGAFAAIQEAVTHLMADPTTDWSRVNIERLRQHLIDMDEVTLHATIAVEPVAGGERYIVMGTGRTREAIRNMLTGHVRAMGEAAHWSLTARDTADGVVVTAMGKAPGDAEMIHALGLMGIVAEGAHHQPHHWMLATGADPHR